MSSSSARQRSPFGGWYNQWMAHSCCCGGKQHLNLFLPLSDPNFPWSGMLSWNRGNAILSTIVIVMTMMTPVYFSPLGVARQKSPLPNTKNSFKKVLQFTIALTNLIVVLQILKRSISLSLSKGAADSE